jgi:hypothetical protein
MPIPGEQPDLSALPPESSPVKRRLAAQHVREARDHLISSSGTRPAFDYELLRRYAQNRLSASLVILLLVATIGFLSSLWTGAVAAGGGSFSLKSKLRIGTEVVVTFPPERVVAAMEPMTQSPPTAPAPGEPGPCARGKAAPKPAPTVPGRHLSLCDNRHDCVPARGIYVRGRFDRKHR